MSSFDTSNHVLALQAGSFTSPPLLPVVQHLELLTHACVQTHIGSSGHAVTRTRIRIPFPNPAEEVSLYRVRAATKARGGADAVREMEGLRANVRDLRHFHAGMWQQWTMLSSGLSWARLVIS